MRLPLALALRIPAFTLSTIKDLSNSAITPTSWLRVIGSPAT